MNNEVNEAFSFGGKVSNFDYNQLNGLGESNYENEDLFNTEVSNESKETFKTTIQNVNDDQSYNYNNDLDQYQSFNSFNTYGTDDLANTTLNQEQKQPFYFGVENQNNTDNESQNFNDVNDFSSDQSFAFEGPVDYNTQEEMLNSNEDQSDLEKVTEPLEMTQPYEVFDIPSYSESEQSVPSFEPTVNEETSSNSNIDDSYLDTSESFGATMFDDEYNLPVVAPTVEQNNDTKLEQKIELGETPISELEKLTHFEEEKIQTTDIKSLFDRVGVNVKEASDIFKKNTEMKEKIDSRFEELKKLQSEVEKSKKSQYDEINSYKEEVLGKLTEKKEEIERRLNRLKEFQSSLEKEKQEFEQYRKAEREEIERVQKEVQEAYDSRREELNHIEDVLRKQKDSLDEERSQLSLDRIQYESDKNELANNLLKFNEIVDSFTSGMDKINKE